MRRIFLALAVDFDDDEAVAALAQYGRDARGCRDLLVSMWRYCKRERTDGHVSREVVGKLAYPDSLKIGIRDADRIVAVGLACHTQTGYYLGGYLKHNKSREQIENEAEAKKHAGRKGGIASGLVRNAEAETKQGASGLLRTDEAIVQRTENREQEVVGLREDRYETLPAALATDPPCTAHPNGDGGTACGGCRTVRIRRDRNQAEAHTAAVNARLGCPDCGGTGWLEDPETRAPAGQCRHPKTARTA